MYMSHDPFLLCRGCATYPQLVRTHIFGSAQESDEGRILGGFLKSDEFGLGSGQALRLQQQVVEIAIAATTTQ